MAARDPSQALVNTKATCEEHLARIRLYGQQYLARALKQVISGPDRKRIVQAALQYLESRTRQSSSSAQASQSLSQAPLTQGLAPLPTVDSSFQSLLASLIDQEISVETLISACAKASDCQLLPIVLKCLSVLAQVGSIRERKTDDGRVLISQSQYEDHELNGTQTANAPNDAAINISQVQPPGAVNTAMNETVRRTGQNFVDEFVTKLAENAAKADQSQSRCGDVFVVSIAREAPMTEHATDVVLHTLTGRMRDVALDELPAYLYQLLLFVSAKGSPLSKSRVLSQIAEVFDKHELDSRQMDAYSQSAIEEDEDAIVPSSTTLKELREIQGTALLHIEFAIKQDPSMSSEVLKLVKSGVENPRHFLTSFGTGILLLLARSASVQNNVLSILRDTISKFDRERYTRKKSIFATRVTQGEGELIDPRQSLVNIAENTCENGWDFVKESLLQFSFVLLDKPLGPLDIEEGSPEVLEEALIVKLFNSHMTMREAILEQLTSRIALQEKSAAQAIKILHTLSEKTPFYVLEHVTHIRDSVDLLVSLPPWHATALMEAFETLFVSRQDLRDHFQLVVRKSLFHRENERRAVAVVGSLTTASLMCVSKTLSPRPQGSQSRPLTGTQVSSEDIISEALQPLRRVFSYSAAVKAFMYKSVIDQVGRQRLGKDLQEMTVALCGVLTPHLRRFVTAERAPYIALEQCVNEASGGQLSEPLGDLIWCLAELEKKRDAPRFDKSYLLDLARKLASVSVQDFSISKQPLTAADAEQAEPESDSRDSAEAAARANRNMVRILGSVAESLVGAVLLLAPERLEWGHVVEVIVPLLVLKGKAFDLLRRAGVGSAGDAFRDLGGDLGIERIRPGARLVFQRPAKAGGSKKSGTKRGKQGEQEGKIVDKTSSASGTTTHSQGHRFGSFSVLASSSQKPSLSLKTCLSTLSLLAPLHQNEQETYRFEEHEESKDLRELRDYVMAVSSKHVSDFVQGFSKTAQDEPPLSGDEISDLARTLDALLRVSILDFRRLRRGEPASGEGQSLMKALQYIEGCAFALPLLAVSRSDIVARFCRGLEQQGSSTQSSSPSSVLETGVSEFEKCVERLIDDALLKEVGSALQILGLLRISVLEVISGVDTTSEFLSKRSQWATGVLCNRKIVDSALVKTLAQTAMLYTENNNDLRRAEDVCERLLCVIGDCDGRADPPPEVVDEGRPLISAESIEKETSLATVEAVLEVIDRAMANVEWCLGRMGCLEAALETHFSIAEGGAQTRGTAPTQFERELSNQTAKQAVRAEDAALTRMRGVVRTLRGLTKCAIAKWSLQEKLLKLVTRCYKLLSAATQAQIKRKGDPRTSFTSLINESKSLAPVLWTYLSFVASESIDEAGAKGASKATREARVMPQLIFEVERFEKLLIAAQKKTKINLLRGMRRNTARDFRIEVDKLQTHEEEENVEDNENDGDDHPGHGAKRRRRGN